MSKKRIAKRIAVITANVLLYSFLIVALIGVTFTVLAKKDNDGATTLFGRQMRYVLTGSMEACDETDVSDYEIKDIPQGSMIFIEVVPEDPVEAEEWYADLKIGDVLTFKYVYVKQETITHRITGIRQNPGGGYTFQLEGDNKNSDANTLTQIIDTSEKNSPNYIIGKVTGQSKVMGSLVSTLKSPTGIIFIIMLPAVIIVMIEVVKITKFFNAGKRKQEQEEKERQQKELEALKRRLEELEGKAKPEATAEVSTAEENQVDKNGEVNNE